jgi:hypothetical protein
MNFLLTTKNSAGQVFTNAMSCYLMFCAVCEAAQNEGVARSHSALASLR